MANHYVREHENISPHPGVSRCTYATMNKTEPEEVIFYAMSLSARGPAVWVSSVELDGYATNIYTSSHL